ncbi:peptidoglycan-associated lipoprotein Pal [Fodinicurvata sp. EGI_FJ10296]|uniref:peptidoglycan-associated lipoprotein Pal n=1 Tax=Fodinicurvata sp. EGI_FJ10296 TaxID=3231908 RepID=UPI003455BB3A
MRLKFAAVMATAILVAACSSTPDQTASATGEGTFSDGDGAGTGTGIDRQVATGDVAPGSQEDLVVNVGDRVFFGFDEYQISQEAQNTLRQQAQWLNRYPNINVVIEGHSDERGTREYNLGLGDRRANAVRSFLVSQGVSDSRISTVSYGKERPAILGSNEDAWARNRRGVTVVN